MKIVEGGITWPRGYSAAGLHAGLKPNGKKDLALFVSDVPAIAKATFTTNAVKAAPLLWDISLLEAGERIRGVVVNSGNANSCTGPNGHLHVEQTVAACARCLHVSEREIFVSSTGVIGVPLPVNKVCEGLEQAVTLLAPGDRAGADAAEAIMTTDTGSKQVAVELEIGGIAVRIGGMAKGSGMIHPNMATMLSYVTTDAAIAEEALGQAVQESIKDAFNMISVDGDTSTNDTALVLANGQASNPEIALGTQEYREFKDALDYVHQELAKAIVRDGEGATKFLEVTIAGADTKEDARRLAKAVITSNLVKTAFFGADANWGRIVSAMGQSGDLDWQQVTIEIQSGAGSIALMKAGEPLLFDEDRAKSILTERDLQIQIHVGNGPADATAWGCDLSYEYVRINGDYRT